MGRCYVRRRGQGNAIDAAGAGFCRLAQLERINVFARRTP